MYKIVGSILVLFTCTGIGLELGREAQKHLEQLEELKKIFIFIKSEIEYSRMPLGSVFRKVSEKTQSIFQIWLRELAKDLEKHEKGTFQKIWEKSIDIHLRGSVLKKQELDELSQIGSSLGYLETLDLYLEQLEFTIQRTREESKSKKKLYQSMGVMGGVFLVIVLL